MPPEIINPTPDCEIVCSRVVFATVEEVFTAWSDPKHLKNWWGPEGFTNTFHEFDFKVGGRWRLTMHGPEKGNYENECEFIAIDRPNLIAWNRISKPLFQVVATFEAVSEIQTKVVFKQIFNNAAECNKLRPFVVDKNEENFDKLEVELAKMTVSLDFFITKIPRPADFYLGYFEGAVFLDFNHFKMRQIIPVRISFDGYGCYGLGERAIPMSYIDSETFLEIVAKPEINAEDQARLRPIILRSIRQNSEYFNEKALKQYELYSGL